MFAMAFFGFWFLVFGVYPFLAFKKKPKPKIG
jgi:hypothetical protein